MPTSIKCGSGLYKNQPGRIENYVPGHSSVSDKARKEVSKIKQIFIENIIRFEMVIYLDKCLLLIFFLLYLTNT